jgi:hypothetical protein
VETFDPDDETPYVEPDEDEGVQLDDDVVAIDADRALALLDRITHDLPGGGESREGQRQMVRSCRRRLLAAPAPVIEAGTGVGKSLAYLVPAVMSGAARRHRNGHQEPPGPAGDQGRPHGRGTLVKGVRSRC